MHHVSLKGTGHYVPEQVVTNLDMSELVDTSDEWIRTRTGIQKRHISNCENTSQLAYEAARKALANGGGKVDELDLIICATITPDSFTPSTACIIQDLLGAKRAVAFDVNAACTGFIYAMNIAAQFLENGVYQNALIIGAETLSKLVDWNDRNTCVLFGDGAGAAYLERSEQGNIKEMVLSADGSKRSLLECNAMPLKNAFCSDEQNEFSQTITMQGGEVFKFAVKAMAGSIEDILKKQNLSIQDIDWIVPHQANFRIIESAAKHLKADPDRFYMNLQCYGNTSSASVAIALDELNHSGRIKQGQKLILVGFGGGMTSGAVLLEW